MLNRSGSNCGWFTEHLRNALHRITASVGERDHTVGLILVDDAFIRRINREYRGIDRETDVISFSYLDEEDVFPQEENTSGELYISYETLEKEAKKRGVDTGHLFLRTAVHGMLHIEGYDHETDREADEMEGVERQILSQLLDEDDINALFT